MASTSRSRAGMLPVLVRRAGPPDEGAQEARRPMRRLLDALARALARLLLHVFYREVEVRGAEHVPREGPVLFVANHGNSLVDPMVLLALLPRMPRFLAKHTLWGNPAVRPLLALAGSVPVYRRQDGDTARNDETFATCFAVLARGGAVALFPEGLSHDAPALQPLRTGAARIALGAREAGSAPVAVVPVGLTFEEKGRFRSRLLVSIGEPLRATPDADDTEEPARALTAGIESGLRDVTLNFDSWHTARLVERAAEIYAAGDGRPLPGRAPLAERFSLQSAFGAGHEAARAKHPGRVAALEARAQRYDGMLRALRLRDDHVTARYPWRHALAYVGERLSTLLLRLPFAVVGLALHWLPYRAPGLVASRVRHSGDLPATYKILTGLFLFPVVWAVYAGIAAWLWGGGAAALVALGAPATGWIALRFAERNESFWGELRAYLTLRLFPERAAELRGLRAEIREELRALVEAAGAEQMGDDSGDGNGAAGGPDGPDESDGSAGHPRR